MREQLESIYVWRQEKAVSVKLSDDYRQQSIQDSLGLYTLQS